MSKRNYLIPVLLVVAICMGTVYASAFSLFGRGHGAPETGRYEKLDTILQILEEDYYIDVDERTLLQGAIDGMLASLDDRYTFYYTPAEMQDMLTESSGQYKGIGVTISYTENGSVVFLEVYEGAPVARAGIPAGSILYAVNGEQVKCTTAQELNALTDRIADFGDEEFTITCLVGGQYKDVTIQREEVLINRVSYEILDSGIGYIALKEFMGNDVSGFTEALSYFESASVKALIIDLRNNPGGYLEDVVNIADMLLPEGLIVYTEDRYGGRREELSDARCVSYPIAVLVNSNSASASEVLSGALQDYGAAVLIGENTFGKGIVQSLYTFEDGSGMQITTEQYYTPSGRCIHGIGLAPDYEVQDDPETPEDEVLLYAVSVLTEQEYEK